MDPKDANLICGVCRKMMSDPYTLPCGHSFCLRPCLLPQDGALSARCINCDAEFEAAKLQPNHKAALQICLVALQREQEKELEQEKEQRVDCGGKVEEQAVTDAKENLKMRLEQLKASITSELCLKKNTKDEFSAIEKAAVELRATVSKALDAAMAKLQMDSNESIEALTQQIDSLSIKVAEVKDVYSSLNRAAVLRGAEEKPTSQDENATKLHVPPENHIETLDQVTSLTATQLTRLINLNMAADNLRAVRTSLLGRQEQSALHYFRLHKELNTAVAAIEMTLTRTFKTSLLRVEANALNVQRALENLHADMGKAQNILLTMPNKLKALDDEKTNSKELLQIFDELQSVQKTAQVTHKALADSNISKYIPCSEGLIQIKKAFANFEFVIQEESADSKDKTLMQTKESVDKRNRSEEDYRIENFFM